VASVIARKDKHGVQITKNEKPAWRMRWETSDPGTGQRSYHYATYYGGKRDAEREANKREIKAREDGDPAAKAKKETVKTYLEDWLRRVEERRKPSTADSYGRAVEVHILPALGGLQVAKLTAAHIRQWIAAMRDGTGPEARTVGPVAAAYARRVLRTALSGAVKEGILRANPVDGTDALPTHHRRADAFTMQETEAILQRAKRSRLAPLFEFAWQTGLRRGELLALRWEDADMEGGMVTVRRSRVVVKGKGFTQEDTKTEAGTRVVALPADAVAALRRAWTVQAKDKLRAGATYRDEGLVFATRGGNAYHPEAVSDEFRRFRNAAGVRRLPFHALRHSAASMLIAAGVSAEVGAKRLGHRRVGTFVDLYGHLLMEANREAAAKLDAFLRDSKAAGSK